MLRAGLTRLLDDAGEEVVAAVGDGVALLDAVARQHPDLAIIDVRMPPSFSDEGIRAAVRIRSEFPGVAVLVLSQYVEEEYASELLAANTDSVGYLLKDRVADVGDFIEAVRRVGAGGTALDPEVVAQLLARSRRQDPLERLTEREREVLVADGRRALERGHRRGARRQRRSRREARAQHLHQARPASRCRGPPSGAGRAALPGVLT